MSRMLSFHLARGLSRQGVSIPSVRLAQTQMANFSVQQKEEYRSVPYSMDSSKLFDKILIANRGEIACRVIASAKKLGIKTVAIYSEPDMQGEHVKMADEAYCVGPAASSESYLSIPKIIEVIKKTGAQAVHPGYGFLSENSHFCEELQKNDTVFIGPNVRAIEAMGDKIESKEFAMKAGVNTVPGCLDVIQDGDHAVKISNDVGYPVMIKATAGGGGKGMRIAWNDDDARQGFRLSTEEARSSFGDDRIFIEKFVEEPRHIEIQLVGDNFGNILTLPERECSIQRRNQKVLEESPSSFIDPETRLEMQKQAAALAKAVGYCSAGTVEFLCDKHKNFYFLEMNTRLQVEHPVTEMVSGIDLVELMIHVAAGDKIPDSLLKEPLPINGWAHEARVYAEDPFRGFLPSIGRLLDYQEPSSDDVAGLRIDSGVTQGSDISMFYDPMISKTIAHGPTREEALNRLSEALDRYVIRGVGHNVNFLRDVCRHPRFRSGEITTKFIEEEYPDGFSGVVLTDSEKAKLVALTVTYHEEQLHRSQLQSSCVVEEPDVRSVWNVIMGKGENKEVYSVKSSSFTGTYYVTKPSGEMDILNVLLDEVDLHVFQGSFAPIEEDDDMDNFTDPDFQYTPSETQSEKNVVQVLGKLPLGYKLQYQGAIEEVHVLSPQEFEYSAHMLEKVEADHSKRLVSPMPGALVSVNVKEGDEVFIGQEVCVVEAMKMQNVLVSEVKGIVKKVHQKAGATLAVDELIVEFE